MREERVLAAGLEGALGRRRSGRGSRCARCASDDDARRADRILALSAAFRRDLVADYGVDPDRVVVVPNCIDLDRFTPLDAELRGDEAPATVAERRPSHRAQGARGRGRDRRVAARPAGPRRGRRGRRAVAVERLLGAAWATSTPASGRALGRLDRDEVARSGRVVACLLQLSRLRAVRAHRRRGTRLRRAGVVTPAVGAAEGLPDDVARVVEPGDVAAATPRCRALLLLAPDERAFLVGRCRAEAARFAPEVVAATLEQSRRCRPRSTRQGSVERLVAHAAPAQDAPQPPAREPVHRGPRRRAVWRSPRSSASSGAREARGAAVPDERGVGDARRARRTADRDDEVVRGVADGLARGPTRWSAPWRSAGWCATVIDGS